MKLTLKHIIFDPPFVFPSLFLTHLSSLSITRTSSSSVQVAGLMMGSAFQTLMFFFWSMMSYRWRIKINECIHKRGRNKDVALSLCLLRQTPVGTTSWASKSGGFVFFFLNHDEERWACVIILSRRGDPSCYDEPVKRMKNIRQGITWTMNRSCRKTIV